MPRELSNNPLQVKSRLRRKIGKVQDEIERLKPLDQWDWEELQRGYPRGPAGKFGPKPAWANSFKTTPEVQKRLKTHTQAQLASHAKQALDTMVELMTNDSVDLEGKWEVPPSVRQKAAEFVLDHVIGKPTSKVEVEAGDSIKDFLADVMVDDDGNDAHPVIIPGKVEQDEEIEEDLED